LKLGFSKHSYVFRPERSQRQALEAVQKTVKEDKEYVVDLERFFGRIHHDRLINRMKLQISDKRILRLTGMVLRSGIMEDGLVRAGFCARKST
jgi:retron-type reverse transcriptase